MTLENPKLLALEAAVRERERLRASGHTVVLTNGVFDLLHPGHLHFLQQARALGDALFVCINADASVRALKGPTRPVQTVEERAYALGALACVSAVVPFSEPRLVAEITRLRPDIYAKAGDYTREKLHAGERAALEACGARLEFLSFLAGYSTTGLIARIQAAAAAQAL